MAEGLIDTREVANNIADLSGIIKNKAYRGSVRGNISNITTNNLVIGTHGNIVEALNLVSQSAHGRMSKEDKKKLDGIEEGSNKYIHPDTHPASMIVETTVKRFVTDAQITAWNAKANRAGDTFTGNVIISTANPTMLNLYRTGANLNNSIKFSLKDGTINKYIGLYDQEFRIGDSEDLSSGGKIWHSRNSYVVPTPETANNARFLRNDNTWQTVTPGNIGAYTKSETYNRTEIDNKFNQMNSGMDWKESVATYNDLATTYPNPEDGWTVNVKDTDYTYRWSGSAWIAISANSIPLASSNVDGKMSKADKAKLDSISAGANAYTHPSTHPATMITEDSTHKFVTQALIDTWNLRITPVKEAANNARFLRNDNTWQTVTPGNIGAYTKSEVDSKINTRVLNSYLQGQSTSNCNSAFGVGVTAKYSTSSATGKPDGTDHALLSLAYSDSWFFQLAGDWRTSNLYIRGSNNNATSPLPWRTVWHSGNSKVIPATETANNARFLRNDNTWQLVTPGNIGAYTKSETYSKTEVDSKNYIRNAGTVTAHDGGGNTRIPNGIRVVAAYNNGYPESYGNVIQVGGTGDAELFLGWSGGSTSTSGAHANNYIRSKRDSGGTLWSGWAKLWTSANFNPASYLPLGGGTMTGTITKTQSSSWISGRDSSIINMSTSDSAYGSVVRQRGSTYTLAMGMLGNSQIGFYSYLNSRTANGTDASFYMTTAGNCAATGTLSASKVYNAVWNDYAELFPKLKSTVTEAGDIIALDISNDKEVYTKATEETSSFIVGVHSDEYAILIGGKKISKDSVEEDLYEYNKSEFIPVGLAGRVKAKCIGIIKKGDKLVISDIPGVARAFNPKLDNINNVFGMAVENKNNPDVITRVRMFIKN